MTCVRDGLLSVRFLLNVFPRLTHGKRRQHAFVLVQKRTNLLGRMACVVAQRPADGLADKKFLLMRASGRIAKQPLAIRALPPSELVQNRHPPDPETL